MFKDTPEYRTIKDKIPQWLRETIEAYDKPHQSYLAIAESWYCVNMFHYRDGYINITQLGTADNIPYDDLNKWDAKDGMRMRMIVMGWSVQARKWGEISRKTFNTILEAAGNEAWKKK